MREFKQKLNVYRVYKAQTQVASATPIRHSQTQGTRSYTHRDRGQTQAQSQESRNITLTNTTPTAESPTQIIAQRPIAKCTFCGRRGHDESVCRLKHLECYVCKQFGHKGAWCPNKSNAVQVCSDRNTTRAMHKLIALNNITFKALIDTGSDVSTVKESCFNQFEPTPHLRPTHIELNGVGNGRFTTLGAADVTILIDSMSFIIEILVVRSEDTHSDIIIGNNFLANHTVVIEKGNVTIEPNFEKQVLNINIQNDSTELPQEIQTIVDSYKPTANVITDVQTQIVLTDENCRVYHNPRRLATSEKQIVEKQIEEWLKVGIVSPSKSEYASPILLTKKKDGSARLCVDYRKLNKIVVKDRTPFPNMEEQLDKLQ